MDWDSAGAIGEIIGAVAVIVSLFYVGSQVKQSSTSVRGQTHESITRAIVDISLLISSDPDLSVAMQDAVTGKELSDELYSRVITVYGTYARIAATAHHQHSLGLLDYEELEMLTKGLSIMLATPTGQRVWKVIQDYSSPACRDYLEDQIKQIQGSVELDRARALLNRE